MQAKVKRLSLRSNSATYRQEAGERSGMAFRRNMERHAFKEAQ